ncbi:MAG: 23S rRNA (adenine(2503)-C(2))-methyltransferase RlmN [Candidatus Pacebacteria bacterium]|nr:23S rRNA (adenine(2503)-C(2))-methyltransferase RlmN [Candidatus Paceibacterota bacterium]
MEFSNIREVIKNEPRYRTDQIMRAVFVDLVEDWDKVTGLSKKLREELKKKCPLEIKGEIFISSNEDSVKVLMPLVDGKLIETVLMMYKGERNSVCVSCQVGCPMGCKFCATGKMGLIRDLTTDEIVSQVLFFSRYLKKEKKRVRSVVFMGMGEPFANYENVIGAIRLMHDPKGLGLGARRFSISTCGLVKGIQKLAKEELDVNLAISLHASNDTIRRKIMPVAQTYTIKELLEVVDDYIAVKHRKVMFEYLMISDLNDRDEHALELAKLMKGKLYVVNLISYNSTGEFKSSTQKRMKHFKNILEENGVEVTIRYRFGRDIQGACGQLATEKGKHQ